MHTLNSPALLLILALVPGLVGTACGAGDGATAEPPEDLEMVDYTTFTAILDSSLDEISKSRAWEQEVPEVREVEIPRSSGDPQPALFYDPPTEEPRPLLVALHSWTADYRKQFSIPYGAWAVKNDWVWIHPNFRGRFHGPEATLSELVVQDILDAREWALANAEVDESRIYVTGFSGGAMASLTMVGRHPDLWTAAAAWVPVYDLVEWYRTVQDHEGLHYADHIVASCGGEPLPDTEAAEECLRRSPSRYLPDARGHDVDVLIATGIDDGFVPPAHALRAYNDLAASRDRLSDAEIEQITQDATVPDRLRVDTEDPLFSAAGKELLGVARSDHVTLWIFDGTHDVVYNAGLTWLARHRDD